MKQPSLKYALLWKAKCDSNRRVISEKIIPIIYSLPIMLTQVPEVWSLRDHYTFIASAFHCTESTLWSSLHCSTLSINYWETCQNHHKILTCSNRRCSVSNASLANKPVPKVNKDKKRDTHHVRLCERHCNYSATCTRWNYWILDCSYANPHFRPK